MSRIDREEMLMEMAITASRRSTCLRRNVGAVIALDGRPLSLGYVGAPSGQPHCTPEVCNESAPCERTIHAEANAIAFAARKGIALEGSELYTTVSPCVSCAKLIINSGIKKVWYLEEYRDQAGINLLHRSGIFSSQLRLRVIL